MLKRILLFTLPAIILATGCSKSPSLVQPTNEYALTNYPNTIAGLQSVLVPAYSAMRDASLYGFEYLPEVMASLNDPEDFTAELVGFFDRVNAEDRVVEIGRAHV